MKFILILILMSLSLKGQESFYEKKLNLLEREQLKVSVNHFRDLHSKSLISRAEIKRFMKEFNEQGKRALSGSQIEKLQKGILAQTYLREELYRIINTYKRYPFTNEEETLVVMDNRLKGGLLALSAACVLIDNYLLSLTEIQENKSLRRLVNKGDSGLAVSAQQLQVVVDSFNSREKRKRFRVALDWFLKHRQKLSDLAKADPQIRELADLVNKSHAIVILGKGNLFEDYFESIQEGSGELRDRLASLRSRGLNTVSKLFGNSVGSVQFRKGLLYEDKDFEEKLVEQLQPLDVILEKTPFRLTDKFISGHFGHVALWLGTEAQLKSKGLWDHPVIAPYQKEISNGHCVLEALRDGVQLNSLAHFLDVDDIAILRKKGDVDNECVIRACRQIGKEYDFNFDVETSDKIVCSELVYHVFVNEKWPTKKTMGRYTISPDHVAHKACEGTFSMEVFIHQGKASTFDKYKELLSFE